jgi:(p)ppGpp synthase/HD superfamily hydrolase
MKVYDLAKNAHKNHFRRDGRTPYFSHLIRVSDRVDSDEEKVVALLHDSIEDKKLSEEELIRSGVPVKCIEAVKVLSKSNNEPYDDYLKKVKRNPLAKSVKIADMLDNLSDDPSEKQIKKYAKGLLYLLD